MSIIYVMLSSTWDKGTFFSVLRGFCSFLNWQIFRLTCNLRWGYIPIFWDFVERNWKLLYFDSFKWAWTPFAISQKFDIRGDFLQLRKAHWLIFANLDQLFTWPAYTMTLCRFGFLDRSANNQEDITIQREITNIEKS